MNLSIIAAVAQNGVIGNNNELPWHLPDDMKYFKEITTHPDRKVDVIMGRKTWESIPEKFRPLPGRNCYVISRDAKYSSDSAFVVGSINMATRLIWGPLHEAFVIGGAQLYKEAMPYARKLYVTEIHAEVKGDVYFPLYDKNQWQEVSRIHHPADERHQYSFDFVTYKRKI